RLYGPGGLFVSIPVVIALAVLVIAFVVLHHTRFGRNVYALGGNEPSARLMGLPVGSTKIAVYAVSGLCSALGGLLLT
ncbi:ABC transporter permease subunit, partial [Streptomyces sp. XY332]